MLTFFDFLPPVTFTIAPKNLTQNKAERSRDGEQIFSIKARLNGQPQLRSSSTELFGRFKAERKGLPAIALTTDTSILTAIGNDYGFERVFSRQVAALGAKGNILMGISTSGDSTNVLEAVASAKTIGMKTIGLLGGNGGKLKQNVDTAIVVPNPRTARIQEAHILMLHYWAGCIEQAVFTGA